MHQILAEVGPSPFPQGNTSGATQTYRGTSPPPKGNTGGVASGRTVGGTYGEVGDADVGAEGCRGAVGGGRQGLLLYTSTTNPGDVWSWLSPGLGI